MCCLFALTLLGVHFLGKQGGGEGFPLRQVFLKYNCCANSVHFWGCRPALAYALHPPIITLTLMLTRLAPGSKNSADQASRQLVWHAREPAKTRLRDKTFFFKKEEDRKGENMWPEKICVRVCGESLLVSVSVCVTQYCLCVDASKEKITRPMWKLLTEDAPQAYDSHVTVLLNLTHKHSGTQHSKKRHNSKPLTKMNLYLTTE